MVEEASKQTAALIANLGLADIDVRIAEQLNDGHPSRTVFCTYTNSDGGRSHRAIFVSRYFENPVRVALCGWFPQGVWAGVVQPLTAEGYRVVI